jgi:RNA polymerase-associated protein LEO1
MSSSALFDEDSSDDDEINPSKKDESKDDSPKRTIENELSADEDNNSADETKEEEPKKTSAVDLFGDGSDDSDDDADADKEKEDTPRKSRPSNSGLFGDDSDDDDDEGEAKLDDVVGSSAPVSSAKIEQADFRRDDLPGETSSASAVVQKPPEKATVLVSTRPGDDLTLHMTKLPNLVAIQPVAFEESLYIEKEEEEQYKGYVQNMIRWRYKRNADGELERDEEGQLIRESNSRMVRWSDGSFTLHIGNEVFDVQTTDSSSGGFAGLNGYVYLSQKAAFSNEGTEDDTPGGTVLECMAPVSSRFVPKPSSLQSEAHKSLTVAVRQRTIKKARIAEHVTFEDPEKAKAARIRNKEDLEKATARKSSSGNRSGGSRYRRPDMSRGYLEEDEDGDYDTTNIRALKKSNRDDDMDDYGDESDDDGFDDTLKARKRTRNQEESEEEELGVDEESDEEHETLIKAHASAKRKPQAVVDDDEED